MSYPKRKVLGPSAHSDPREAFHSAKVMQSEKKKRLIHLQCSSPRIAYTCTVTLCAGTANLLFAILANYITFKGKTVLTKH